MTAVVRETERKYEADDALPLPPRTGLPRTVVTEPDKQVGRGVLRQPGWSALTTPARSGRPAGAATADPTTPAEAESPAHCHTEVALRRSASKRPQSS
jgi:hypothetical protein